MSGRLTSNDIGPRRSHYPPIIFRDVREFVTAFDSAIPMATTAYGSKVAIPLDIDIVIAGTSCVDYSMLNNKKKNIDDDGESGQTWYGVLEFCKATKPSIVMFENVVSANWDRMLEHYDEAGYETAGVVLDTKEYYLPHTRQRGYMVGFNRSATKLSSGIGERWQSLMKDFKRPASSPVLSFLIPSTQIRHVQQARDDEPAREIDWSQCEITQMQTRQEERLGYARPFTKWQESGSISIPDHSSRTWFRSQPERVWDCYDCGTLRKSKDEYGGYDARFKLRIWDFTQNIYRMTDTNAFGVTGCLTPRCQPFLSDAGRPMTPEECLQLQGLPLNKMMLTTETRAELADLAGNAMSSTVIGPAILAALICGHQVISPDIRTPVHSEKKALVGHIENEIVQHNGESFMYHDKAGGKRTDLVVQHVLDAASKAARRCYCEGSHGQSKAPIQRCVDCGHTTCIVCGGNPVHNYRQDQILSRDRADPSAFEESLRSKLPLRLELANAVEVKAVAEGDPAADYRAAVRQAVSSDFTFSRIVRTHGWTITYEAPSARLDLVIEGGIAIEWRLFAMPEKSLAVESELRKELQVPIAKAAPTRTLLDGSWMLRSAVNKSVKVQIQGVGLRVPAWRARNEMPDYIDDKQWSQLQVRVLDTHETDFAVQINGTYRYLPRCGTACDSLYVREDAIDGQRPLYLFLDPTKTGDPDLDTFVFAHSHARLDYGEGRFIIARIEPSWRPWSIKTNDPASKTLQVQPEAIWEAAPATMRLQPLSTRLDVQRSSLVIVAPAASSCHKALQIVSCSTADVHTEILLDQDKDSVFLEEQQWLLEAMERQLPGAEWIPVDGAELSTECTDCAPQRPALRWRLEDDKSSVVGYEDPAGAATYERAIKSQPSPVIMKRERDEACSEKVTFALNVYSMTHRALSRLPQGLENVGVRWRLAKDSVDAVPKRTSFKLSATRGIEPFTGDLGMSVSLFPKQQLSLAWMRQQEAGHGQRFTLEESEEAQIVGLRRRAEVRAQADVFVRGGICADHPGFGKTITSLALIQAELMERTKALLVEELKSRQSGDCVGLLPISATLIVCPHVLVEQWMTEIKEKLRMTSGYFAIRSTADLTKRKIEDFQKAKIIVVNRSVFGTDTYSERLAAFAGIPGPATKTERGYTQWLRFVSEQIPDHLKVLQESGSKRLGAHLKQKYATLLQSDDFKATVPSRRLKGKEYVAARAKGSKTSATTKAAASTLDVENTDRPLFEMFHFNRLIVDEFHQYDAKEFAAIKALKADKRWGLSATPALSDLYDVAQIADLLSIRLNVGSVEQDVMKSKNIRALRKEMTKVELFIAMLQTPSAAKQARLCEVGQNFLDTFVRRNIMDFAEIKCAEHLLPTALDLGHRAVYTELSQHLNSSDMRIKKSNKSKATSREQLLNSFIGDSQTAEEALSRTAAFFERDGDTSADAGSGLQSLIDSRERELEATSRDLSKAIVDTHAREKAAYRSWKRMCVDDGRLGDDVTIATIKRLLPRGVNEESAKSTSKAKAKRKAGTNEDDEEGAGNTVKPGKEPAERSLTSTLNQLGKRLLTSHRSLRFLKNVQRVQQARSGNASLRACESAECHGSLGSEADVAVSAFCGHMVCRPCLERLREKHVNRCPAPGCAAEMHSYNLFAASKMGDLRSLSHTPYGAKLDAAMDILETIQQKKEQAILFVQHANQIAEVKRALADRSIPAIIVENTTSAAAQIADFRSPTNTNTVIVLNASDETAAGSNLQNANHVIFLSPLLRDSQYGYEATMAQAVGRVRRHGQKRGIHIYRLVALDSIDVDILEHRERRTEALVEMGALGVRQPEGMKRLVVDGEVKVERVQLVREQGRFSLRPQSWLVKCGADEEAGERVKGRSRVLGCEDFSSLVKFSRAYGEDDE